MDLSKKQALAGAFVVVVTTALPGCAVKKDGTIGLVSAEQIENAAVNLRNAARKTVSNASNTVSNLYNRIKEAGGNGAPIATGGVRNSGLSKAEVTQVQTFLNKAKCNAGTADGDPGRMGKNGGKTTGAALTFLWANGIPLKEQLSPADRDRVALQTINEIRKDATIEYKLCP